MKKKDEDAVTLLDELWDAPMQVNKAGTKASPSKPEAKGKARTNKQHHNKVRSQ